MAGAERPYQSLSIINLRRSGGLDNLLRYVWRGEEPTAATLATLDTALQHNPASVVVEAGYADRDHAASHSNFYVRAFQNVPRHSTRLHFFTTRIRRPDLDNLAQYQDDYVGYITLRPLSTRVCGRTVLTPPLMDEHHFTLAKWRFDASIAGSQLTVSGSPFLEQDARVAACATAAIWMSAESLAPRLRLSRFNTSDITGFATAYAVGDRAVPSGGLSQEQMAQAFRTIGFDPATEMIYSKDAALTKVYPYVESGLAPVLLLQIGTGGYHAVVAVGHTFDSTIEVKEPAIQPSAQGDLAVWRSWQSTDGFLVNDDQRGPYRTMRFIDVLRLSEYFKKVYDIEQPAFTYGWRCPVLIDMDLAKLSSKWHKAELADLYGAIIPLPSGLSLSAEEAHVKVVRVIGMWYDALELPFPGNLYLRTYLARSAEFKYQMSENNDLHPFVRQLYRGKNLPRWIWVTEVAWREEILGLNPASFAIRGEVLLDPNSNPETGDFVALHMPLGGDSGHVTTMLPGEIQWTAVRQALRSGWLLEGDFSYPPLLR